MQSFWIKAVNGDEINHQHLQAAITSKEILGTTLNCKQYVYIYLEVNLTIMIFFRYVLIYAGFRHDSTTLRTGIRQYLQVGVFMPTYVCGLVQTYLPNMA